MINIKNHTKSYENIFIYFIGRVAAKALRYIKTKTNKVNYLYLIIVKTNGYIEYKAIEINI